jgi:WD40 repeat protein/serine/threonine protein kinase
MPFRLWLRKTAYERLLDARRQHVQARIEEYVERYPHLAAVIGQILPALQAIQHDPSEPAAVSDFSSSELPVTGTLGDFRIFREIGRGGMGIVYEAEQVSLGRRVALKILPFTAALDPKQLQRFKIEAQAAAHLHHQNIVPVHGVGCERGVHYYAMQFIEGQTLANLIRELRQLAGLEAADQPDSAAPARALASELLSGQWAPAKPRSGEPARPCGSEQPTGPYVASLPQHLTPSPPLDATPPVAALSTERFANSPAFFRTVAHLGVQAAEALEHAHAKGIIHRDIKPGNLLIDVSGNLWITDFGLARMLSEAGLTMTGDLVGTLRYMSPEQALAKRAPLDHRTDIYSLGVTLYELLTLRPAQDGGDRQEIMQQIAFGEPRLPRRLNKAIPAELEIIVRKAIGKNPAERYATAQELADDLRRFLDDKPIRAKRPTLLDWTRKWARRHQGIVATGIAGLIVAVGILTVSALMILSAYRTEAVQRQRAETNLYRSLVGQARALRQARGTGYRSQALDLLNRALDLQTPEKNLMELRNEAVACMGDFVGLKPTTWDDFSADTRCLALRPDGVQMALGLEDGTLLVRDISTGDNIAQLPGHRAAVVSLSFSANGKGLVSADLDGKIHVWLANAGGTWELERTISISDRPSKGATVAAVLAPDGKYLAACCSDQSFVSVWSLTAEVPVARFPGREGENLLCLAVSPDGRLLAAGYKCAGQHGISIWDVATRQLKPPVHCDFHIGTIRFSPDGRRLSAGSYEGAAIYDTLTLQSLLPMRWDCWVDMAFSPDGQTIALVGRHGITLWDVLRNGEVARLQRPDPVERVAFSTDGKTLVASAPRCVLIYNLAGAEEKLALSQRGHNGGVAGLAFSPDGKRLASGGKDLTVKIWDTTTGTIIRELTDFGASVESVDFSPDGRMLATGEWGSGSIRIWDVQTWQELPAPAHDQLGKRISTVAFSPDGRYFAACGNSGGDGGGVMLWPLDARRPVPERAIRLSSREASSLCFSPDSSLLAWVERAEPSSLRLCDLGSSRVRSLPQAQPIFRKDTLAFRGGKELVLITDKAILPEVWDITTSKRVYAPEIGEFTGSNPSDGGIYGGRMALSADRAWLAQGDFRVWDLQSRKPLLLVPEERAGPLRLTWSPNSELLALGLTDGELVIWNFRKIKAQLDAIGLGW